jgi:hypothetical protein
MLFWDPTWNHLLSLHNPTSYRMFNLPNQRFPTPHHPALPWPIWVKRTKRWMILWVGKY